MYINPVKLFNKIPVSQNNEDIVVLISFLLIEIF